MSVSAMCMMSYCTVLWVDMNSKMRALVGGTNAVGQSFINITIHANNLKEEMEKNYERDLQTLLRMSVDHFVNPVIERVEDRVRDAVSEGKDMQHCYDKVVKHSLSVSNEKFNEMLPCLNNLREEFDDNMKIIHGSLKETNKMINIIHNIVPGCRLKLNPPNCIEVKAAQAMRFLKEYEKLMKNFEGVVRENYHNSVTDVLSCVSGPTNELKLAAEAIETAAKECIDT